MVLSHRVSVAPRVALCLVAASMAIPTLVLHSQGRVRYGRRQAVRIGGHEAVAGEALVTLRTAEDVTERAAIAASVDADEDEHVAGRVRRIHSKRFSAEVLLAYLRTVAAVEAVEPNWIVHAD